MSNGQQWGTREGLGKRAQQAAPLRVPIATTLLENESGQGMPCPYEEMTDRTWRTRGVSNTRKGCRAEGRGAT